jgi:hypothetical protein
MNFECRGKKGRKRRKEKKIFRVLECFPHYTFLCCRFAFVYKFFNEKKKFLLTSKEFSLTLVFCRFPLSSFLNVNVGGGETFQLTF